MPHLTVQEMLPCKNTPYQNRFPYDNCSPETYHNLHTNTQLQTKSSSKSAMTLTVRLVLVIRRITTGCQHTLIVDTVSCTAVDTSIDNLCTVVWIIYKQEIQNKINDNT